jgi:hypothetical protein
VGGVSGRDGCGSGGVACRWRLDPASSYGPVLPVPANSLPRLPRPAPTAPTEAETEDEDEPPEEEDDHDGSDATRVGADLSHFRHHIGS